MVDKERIHVDDLQQRALRFSGHPDKAVSLLLAACMTILQRRYGPEKAIEYMVAGLGSAGGVIRKAISNADCS